MNIYLTFGKSPPKEFDTYIKCEKVVMRNVDMVNMAK